MAEFDIDAFLGDEAPAPRKTAPLVPGNIDLKNRPRVKNADGSISTVRSMGVNIDGQEVLIPTVSDDGRIMSDDEAVATYKRTGRHLGKFRTPEESTAYAQQLHEDQARMIAKPAGFDIDAFLSEAAPPETVDMGPAARRVAGGGSPSKPREFSAEQVEALPDHAPQGYYDDIATHDPAPGQSLPSRVLVGNKGPLRSIRSVPSGEMRDPLVQMGTSSAIGMATGGGAQLLGAPKLAASMIEGAASNAAAGGDASAGAAAALLPNVAPAARAVMRGGRKVVDATIQAGERAATRVGAKATTAATGEDFAALAPTERTRLAQTFERHPELRRDLYDAKTNPEKAHTAVSNVVTKANARLDEMTPQITAKGSTDQLLADYDALLASNRGDVVKTEAIKRQRDAVANALGDAKEITPEELRRLTHSIGRGPNAATLYGPIARQLERVAKLSDVDVPAFMAAHRDVATLTPYATTLNEKAVAMRTQRVRKLAEMGKAIGQVGIGGVGAHFGLGVDPATAAVVGGTVYGATKLGQAVARRVDYKLAQLAEMARNGPLPRAALEDAAASGVPPALLLQLGQRFGVQEQQR